MKELDKPRVIPTKCPPAETKLELMRILTEELGLGQRISIAAADACMRAIELVTICSLRLVVSAELAFGVSHAGGKKLVIKLLVVLH